MLDATPQDTAVPPEVTDTPASGAPRAVAFLLPQFHPTPENDAFWGTGFTEWRNVARARPRFRGHDQPHLPADLGFYDLRLAETRAAQARLARRAGLSGFAWYHYWFAGRRVLDRPFDAVLADRDYDFPFLLCWANENWTRAWDGGPREVLIAQNYSDADTRAHARHLAPALADARAIRLGGRPVFAVYAVESLPDPRRWSEVFRETLAREGIEVHLLRVERHLDRDDRPPAAIGFDGGVDFQPFSRGFGTWQRGSRALSHRLGRRVRGLAAPLLPDRDAHHDLARFVAAGPDPAPDYPWHPGVCPSWDNSARRPPGRAIIFRNTSPELFSRWTARQARCARSLSDETGEERLLFVNAWNEWAEGNHLEPCLTHGHAWIDALSRGLSAAAETPGATCIR